MAIKYITRRAEDKKWCVKNAKADKATRVFNTQKEAIDYAKTLKSTTSIMIQGRDGKFRKVSAWNSIKKAPVSAVKATANATKKVTKATTNTAKKAVGKKPAEKPVVEEEITSTTKEDAIKELKAQNAALDAQILKEKQEAEAAEAAAKAEEAKKAEETVVETKVEAPKKAKKSTGKKVALAFGIIFLLLVIAASVILVLDWQEKITFINLIKK